MRSFTIVSIQDKTTKLRYTDGRFISNTPREAAKKMFTKAHNNTNKKVNSLLVTLRETTQGSAKKEYKYRVTKKSERIQVERDGEMITYNFITKVKSMN